MDFTSTRFSFNKIHSAELNALKLQIKSNSSFEPIIFTGQETVLIIFKV